jgi:hypothetical protein
MILDGVKAKLDRAREHILAVDAALSGGDPLARHVMVISRKLPPQQHVIEIDEITPMDPARVPVVVGEVLQNLRSALDHLIGDLERGNGMQRDSEFEFPIYWDGARYKKESPRRIKGVPAAAAAIIERNQPYHRRAPSYKDHPLWILHDLNNADKHRVLVGTGTSITVDNLDIGIAPGVTREVVLSVSPRYRANPQPEAETAINERWTLNATFTQFGQRAHQAIIPGLVELADAVTRIVSECRAA